MKLLKWIFVFTVAFLAACILIFTFSQEPFRALVPGRILVWHTPAIPIYAYVGGAFGIGLLIGLLTILYNYIVYQTKMHRKNRTITELELQLSEARQTAEINEIVTGNAVELSGNPSIPPATVTDNHHVPDGAA